MSARARFFDGSDDHCAHAEEASVRPKTSATKYRKPYLMNSPHRFARETALKAETRRYSPRARRSMQNRRDETNRCRNAWRLADTKNDLSISPVHSSPPNIFSNSRSGAPERMIPIGCSFGGGTILLTTHFGLWCIRRFHHAR